ncbi:hypothetical protein ACU686_31940 [Yinghuangia aomiensis]
MHDEVDISALRRRRTVKWRSVDGDVLAAWVAEMDFAVAEPVREAVTDAVARQDFGYRTRTPGPGCPTRSRRTRRGRGDGMSTRRASAWCRT